MSQIKDYSTLFSFFSPQQYWILSQVSSLWNFTESLEYHCCRCKHRKQSFLQFNIMLFSLFIISFSLSVGGSRNFHGKTRELCQAILGVNGKDIWVNDLLYEFNLRWTLCDSVGAMYTNENKIMNNRFFRTNRFANIELSWKKVELVFVRVIALKKAIAFGLLFLLERFLNWVQWNQTYYGRPIK